MHRLECRRRGAESRGDAAAQRIARPQPHLQYLPKPAKMAAVNRFANGADYSINRSGSRGVEACAALGGVEACAALGGVADFGSLDESEDDDFFAGQGA